MKLTILISVVTIFSFFTLKAQLPDGSIAMNFTIFDIDSNEHNLYNYLDNQIGVVLWFFNVNNGGDDWAYWQTNYYQAFHNIYGPEGTNEGMVFMIVCSPNATVASLTEYGYLNNSPFPVIITQELNDLYGIDMANFISPTYMVCTNRFTTDVTGSDNAYLYQHLTDCPSYEPENEADVNLWSIENIDKLYCSSTVKPTVLIRNEGSGTITSMDILIYLDEGSNADTVHWNGNIDMYYFEEIVLPEIEDITAGVHELIVELIEPNGIVDPTENNILTENFTFYENTVDVNLNIQLDEFPQETNWTISRNDEVLFSSPNYNFNHSLSYLEELICLEVGECYTLSIEDEGMDGMDFGIDGFFEILFHGNTVLFVNGSDFTASFETEFCIELSSANEMLSFGFAEQTSPAYFDLTNNKINVEVLHGTDLTSLVANFTISDHAMAEVNGVEQISGETVNDFSNLVNYIVIAENGNEKNYLVEVRRALSSSDPVIDHKNIIYPNPNNGILYFINEVMGELSIISVSGKVVENISFNRPVKQFDVQNLDNGFYVLRIIESDSVTYSTFELKR